MADGIFKRLLKRRFFSTGADQITDKDRALMRLLAPHFDRRFYLIKNTDVAAAKIDPLLHFVRYGNAERRDPSPAFCVATYVMRYPQVAETGTNALLHYLETGSKRGAIVDVADETEWRERASFEIELQRSEFDADFYLTKNADIGTMDALYHYAKFGWLERRDPSPHFSTSGYLELNRDVAEAGINPFFHWIAEGRKEGRPIVDPQASEELGFQLDIMRPYFDENHYLLHLEDDLPRRVDALRHFATVGWKQGRNPNRSFSVTGYLSIYDDVREVGVNPFYHYLVEGRREGREQHPQSSYRCSIVAGLQGLEEGKTPSLQWSSDIDIDEQALTQLMLSDVDYALTFSHDDYSKNVGGLQLCLRRESLHYGRVGIRHIHLFPAHATLQISRQSDPVWGVLLDGSLQGRVAASSFLACLAKMTSHGIECVSLAVHSLLGHTADLVIKAVRACAVQEAIFWVHDYSSVCAGLRLMRNDVEWCGAPPSGSSACRVCIYNTMRRKQVLEFHQLFAGIPLRVVAPWETAATIFVAHHPHLPTTVREHLRLRQSRSRDRKAGAIRIAFLGHPAAHKGWYDFVQLVEAFADRSDVAFFHVSSDGRDLPKIQHVLAAPDREGRSTFPDAVEDEGIDFAFVGSLWRETFCLVAYEAVAGGAEILTYAISGQPVVLARQGHGHVFDDLPEVIAFVGERLAQRDVRASRPLFDLDDAGDEVLSLITSRSSIESA